MKNEKLGAAFVITLALALSAGSAAAGGKPGGGGGKPPAVDLVSCVSLADYVNDSCNPELQTLCDAIDTAHYNDTTKDPAQGGVDDQIDLRKSDRDTMVSKVIGAQIKIQELKFDEADGKLGEIEAKLLALFTAPKQKISDADEALISDPALIDARGCVDGLL